MYIIGNLILGLTNVLDSILFIYSIIVIASVVISWVNADPYNQIVRIINMLTAPVFKKARKYLPTAGPIDLAPIAILLAIMFIQAGILPSLKMFAVSLL